MDSGFAHGTSSFASDSSMGEGSGSSAAAGAASETASADWRANLPLDMRKKIVLKILGILKRRFPVDVSNGVHQLESNASQLEENIYLKASSKDDYLKKISEKLASVLNQRLAGQVPPGSTSQTGNQGIVDSQGAVYQKIKNLKELYFDELNEIHQKVTVKMQQYASLGDHSEKNEHLRKIKGKLLQILHVFQNMNSSLLYELKDKVHLFEKQVMNMLSLNRRKISSSQLPGGSGPEQFKPSGGQAQYPQPSEAPLVQQHHKPANHVEQMSLRDSTNLMKSAAVTSIQHGSLSSSVPLTLRGLGQQQFTPSGGQAQYHQSSEASFMQQLGRPVNQMEQMSLPDSANSIKSVAPSIQHGSLSSSVPLAPRGLGQRQFMPSIRQAQCPQASEAPMMQQLGKPANHAEQMSLWDSANSIKSFVVPSMQQGSMPPSMSFAQLTDKKLASVLQSGSSVDQVQGNSSIFFQQEAIKSKPQIQGGVVSVQNNMGSLKQTNANILSNPMNVPLRPSPNGPWQWKQNQQQAQHQQFVVQSQQQHHMQQQRQKLQMQQQLQQKQQQQAAQLLQHQTSQVHNKNRLMELNKFTHVPGMNLGFPQQHYFANQQQHKSVSEFPVPSHQHLKSLSPQIDQHCPRASQQKSGLPLQLASSPSISSPSTSLSSSPLPADPEKPLLPIPSSLPVDDQIDPKIDVSPPQVQALSVDTPGTSTSPVLAELTSPEKNQSDLSAEVACRTNEAESPIKRLVKVAQSVSSMALSSTASDISTFVHGVDSLAGSTYRRRPNEDLVATVNHDLHSFSMLQGETRKRALDACVTQQKCPLEPCAKMQKVKVNHALLEEIRQINHRLTHTELNISDEDAEPSAYVHEAKGGTIVSCSFTTAALCPTFQSQFDSAQLPPISPLRMLVPADYPKSSPVLLDEFPDSQSNDSDDLSTKIKSRFGKFVSDPSEPISLSLREMASAWDNCAREVITEYAVQAGGGSFTSKYGGWQKCVAT